MKETVPHSFAFVVGGHRICAKVQHAKMSGNCKEVDAGRGTSNKTPSARRRTPMTEYILQRYCWEKEELMEDIRARIKQKSVEGKSSQPAKQENSPTGMGIGVVTRTDMSMKCILEDWSVSLATAFHA